MILLIFAAMYLVRFSFWVRDMQYTIQIKFQTPFSRLADGGNNIVIINII